MSASEDRPVADIESIGPVTAQATRAPSHGTVRMVRIGAERLVVATCRCCDRHEHGVAS